MSKFVSRAGSQIDELQRHLADPNAALSQQSYYRNNPNAPRLPSRLQQSFGPIPEEAVSAPLLRPSASALRHSARRNSQDKLAHRGKLGTFEGAFLPVILNIWGVILYLRLGYIIGHAGLIVTILMFICGYSITTFTTLSLSAISTNGTVRGIPFPSQSETTSKFY